MGSLADPGGGGGGAPGAPHPHPQQPRTDDGQCSWTLELVDFKLNITELNKYFVGISNLWIVLPTKLNVQ